MMYVSFSSSLQHDVWFNALNGIFNSKIYNRDVQIISIAGTGTCIDPAGASSIILREENLMLEAFSMSCTQSEFEPILPAYDVETQIRYPKS